MKRFLEILEEIKVTIRAKEIAKKKEDELIDSYMKIHDKAEKLKAKKAIENDIIEISRKIEDLKITIQILGNNAKIALFHEVMPVALEILSKYQNKPYGEKTQEKITNEILAITNCRFYIDSRYSSQQFNIYPVGNFANNYKISCGTQYIEGKRKQLLIDNKIQLVNIEDLTLHYIFDKYVDDIPQHIEKMRTLYNEAYIKQKELEKICEAFNDIVVGDIASISVTNRIYENMLVR